MGIAPEQVLTRILGTETSGRRRLVAVAGPPASGKSTFAAMLGAALNERGHIARVIPMDGFHLHNQILIERGLLDRKGAPQTFDAGGFASLVQRLAQEDAVYYPEFDRARDIAIAGAGYVGPECQTVVVEGNYLLLDQPIWRGLRGFWDLSIWLDVALPVLEQRLIDRWLEFGMTRDQAVERAGGNDIPNARLVVEGSLPADLTV